jgi:pimeloyl-ACP methyl ester carboxylesterase
MPNRRTMQSSPAAVHVRRAYFDCRFGQLHVRTAFPANGGFNERTTLVCLHPRGSSSRMFDALLRLIAVDRSVYAPDTPGCGESDPPPQPSVSEYAAAMGDLLDTLRLRKIDLLSCGDGALIAAELSGMRQDLVRKRLDLPESALPQLELAARRVREALD